MHVCRSQHQQLPWGCVPMGAPAQVPPNGKMESPGPATGKSVYIRPGTGGLR